MKKWIALLLCLTMALSLTAALAETAEAPAATEATVDVADATPTFDVTMVIPEGYTMTEDRSFGNLYLDVLPEDTAAPEYWISIGFSEEYDGRSIADLSEDEVQLVKDAVELAFNAPVWMDYTTKEGTLVHMVDETEGESDWALAFTVYKGYFITVQIEKDDYAQLSDADLTMAIELLGDMHFVDQA